MSNGRESVRNWMDRHVAYHGDDCLNWPFAKNWNGYGILKYKDRITYAHRVMCELAHGEALSDRHVAAHQCGRGQNGCVNPRHLKWKTPAENQHDRKMHGTSNPTKTWNRQKSIISAEVRHQIIGLKGKKNQREIAALFGISYQHVSLIQRGLRRQPQRILTQPMGPR